MPTEEMSSSASSSSSSSPSTPTLRSPVSSACISASSSYTDLHLCDEDLDEIPSRYLAPCPGIYSPDAVRRLDLSRNNFLTINGLPIFANLISLDMSNNGLTAIPDDIAALRQLRFLSARNNLLEDIPKTLLALTELETINLSGNRLTEFPPILLEMPNIKALYLGANRIDAIPYGIPALRRLQVLYLGGNRLRDVPATIGCLEELVNLTLCDNQLETIPSTVAELRHLECLSLHNNQLKTLPTEIVRLRNLQQLSLRNNPLVHTFIDSMSFDPPSLKEIAGRFVRRFHTVDDIIAILPCDLTSYLLSANQCVNPKCKGVYFEACVEHVKFVDFCGKYRVPLLQFLCSARCSKHSVSPPGSSATSSSDSEDEPSSSSDDRSADDRMRRVLLG